MSLNATTFNVGGLYAGDEARIVTASPKDFANQVNVPLYSSAAGTTQLPNPFILPSGGSITVYTTQPSSQLGIIVAPKQ